MRGLSLISAIMLSAGSVYAADGKSLSTFDIYGAPYTQLGSGTYKVDDTAEGSTASLQTGVRAGFKLGPILLGGELALTGIAGIDNTIGTPTTANRIKYPLTSSTNTGTVTAIGLNLGLTSDRITLWGSYFPASSLEIKMNDLGTSFTNSYSGDAYAAEINFRVWDRLQVGVFAQQREFSKYSTDHSSGVVKGAELDPKLKYVTYGITISYLMPFSDMAKGK